MIDNIWLLKNRLNLVRLVNNFKDMKSTFTTLLSM